MLGLALGFSAVAASEADPVGRWKGAIELPNGELAIAVTLKAEDGGSWSGTIDIPAQGLRGFSLSNVLVEGPRVHFEMDGVPGQPTFEGRLDDDGEALAGSFQQGSQSLSFTLRRAAEEAQTEKAPDLPAKPVVGEGAPGDWLGVLEVGPMRLRLALDVEVGEGGLKGTLRSVDQGADLTVDSIQLEQDRLSFAIARIGASYEGTLKADGSAIEGTWSQGGRSLPLTFDRLAEPFALKRPQEPKAPFPYESRQVTFRNEGAGLTLAGTLVLPAGEGPFPAVVLITGSGPQDRDESLMGHKPFWVLADFLARRGIASLRYDDRGAGASEGDHLGSTVADFTADAEAAVTFLAAQPEIDRKALGIIGHSEGGLTGPRVAQGRREIDFLVLLAPPGEPLTQLLRRQTEDVLRQQGVPEALVEKAVAAQAEDLELVQDEALGTEQLGAQLKASAEKWRQALTEDERARLGLDAAAEERSIAVATSAWFRSLVREDPAVYLKTLKIPVLALFGEKDIQVAAPVNARIVEASLKTAGNQDFEVLVLPGLNHLFQHAETGAVAEYGSLEETFAPEALERIGHWIEKRFLSQNEPEGDPAKAP